MSVLEGIHPALQVVIVYIAVACLLTLALVVNVTIGARVREHLRYRRIRREAMTELEQIYRDLELAAEERPWRAPEVW